MTVDAIVIFRGLMSCGSLFWHLILNCQCAQIQFVAALIQNKPITKTGEVRI